MGDGGLSGDQRIKKSSRRAASLHGLILGNARDAFLGASHRKESEVCAYLSGSQYVSETSF